MTNRNTIVFPTDFSGLSLVSIPWVKRLAAMLDAEVHCIYGVEEPRIYATLGDAAIPMPTTDELVANAESTMKSFVEQHLQELDDDPVQKIIVGKSADVIVDYANSIDAKMILITTHGHSGFKHLLLGSTTEAVLRRATCPVLSIRNTDEE